MLGVFVAGLILIGVGSGCGESSPSAETTGGTASEGAASPTAPPNPEQQVQDALGDEVQAGGYAGDLEIQNVDFDGTEAQVFVKTPEGGLEGASCADMDEGARAVFEAIYNDGGWKGGAAVVYKGGLVDTATGKELPDANAGIFTMHAGQAKKIDWSDEDALANIDWSFYRDFCHPAFQ